MNRNIVIDSARAQMTNLIVRASSQCSVKWTELSGDDRVRWSYACQHFVYNPAVLTEQELVSLIWFREGVRPGGLYKRKDGTLIIRNCQGSSKGIDPASLAIALGLSTIVGLIASFSISDRPIGTVAQSIPLHESVQASPRDTVNMASAVVPQSNASSTTVAGMHPDSTFVGFGLPKFEDFSPLGATAGPPGDASSGATVKVLSNQGMTDVTPQPIQTTHLHTQINQSTNDKLPEITEIKGIGAVAQKTENEQIAKPNYVWDARLQK